MNQGLLNQDNPPTTRQRIADLNECPGPAELSHYFPPAHVEGAYFNGGRPVAFCGYRLPRRPDALDVTSTSKGEYVPPEVMLCPYCHVLYSRLPGRGND